MSLRSRDTQVAALNRAPRFDGLSHGGARAEQSGIEGKVLRFLERRLMPVDHDPTV